MICTQEEIIAQLGFDLSTISPNDMTVINTWHPICENLVRDFVGYEITTSTYTEYYPDYAQRGPADMLVEGYELSGNRAVPYPRYFEDRRVLFLKNLPIVSIGSVYEYPGAWNADPATPNFPVSSLLGSGNYMVDYMEAGKSLTGFLYRLSGVWSNFERCIKITYTAGYTPSDLGGRYNVFKAAVLMTMEWWFNSILANRYNQKAGVVGGPITREEIGNYRIFYDPTVIGQGAGLGNKLPKAVMKMLEKYVRVSQYI